MSACRRWTPQSGASGFRQFLSRLEGEALLSALTHTVVTIEVAGASVRRPNNMLRTLAHLLPA